MRSAGFRIEMFGSAEDFLERGNLGSNRLHDEAVADSCGKCDVGRHMIGALYSVRSRSGQYGNAVKDRHAAFGVLSRTPPG